MGKQLTLELKPANESLVGIVFREQKNRVPLPCTTCSDSVGSCRGKSRCFTYTQWLARDGKIVDIDRYVAV